MRPAYQVLKDVARNQGLKFQTHDASETICAGFEGENGSYEVVAHADSDMHLFRVLGRIPVPVPAGARSAVAELTTRLNFGLPVGNFEMNFSGGELGFTASSWIDDVPSESLIGSFLGTTVAILDMYMPAILSVIYANESPEDAISHVQQLR